MKEGEKCPNCQDGVFVEKVNYISSAGGIHEYPNGFLKCNKCDAIANKDKEYEN